DFRNALRQKTKLSVDSIYNYSPFSSKFMSLKLDTLITIGTFSPKTIFGELDLVQILKLIDTSKSEINLQYLTYSINTYDNSGNWYEIDSAIIRASKRGVKVKLIVSDWNL